jgi:NAD(P)-dependent dehydrogenase (short-subunit alcohol dehydrogenase family)
MGKLEGKIALVTGGNSGIGLATAKQFVKEGAYVFITGRRDRELAAAVKEIGRNVTGVQGDVSNLGDLDRLFAQIKREKGKLDVVFANAGVAKYAPFGKIAEELYDSIFDINVKGLLFTVQKALPLMPDGASVILNASLHRHARAERSAGLLGNRRAASEDDFRRGSARQVRYARRDRQGRGAHPTTAATSRERNCSWMAASHKCRLRQSGTLDVPKRTSLPQSGEPQCPVVTPLLGNPPLAR